MRMCGLMTWMSGALPGHGRAVGLVLAMVLAGGCAFKGGPGAWFGDHPGPLWEPEPEQVQILPHTAYVRVDEQDRLRARVAFVDGMDDPCKAVGTVRLQLFELVDGEPAGEHLYNWRVDLHTLEDQQRHWDRVTRSYHFELGGLGERAPSEPVLLRVTFMPAERADRIETERRLEPEAGT